MDAEALGRRIAVARRKAGHTQESLSTVLGCVRQHVSGIETGSVDVQLQELRRLATACNTTVLELLGSPAAEKYSDPDQAAQHDLLQDILTSNKELAAAVKTILRTFHRQLDLPAETRKKQGDLHMSRR